MSLTMLTNNQAKAYSLILQAYIKELYGPFANLNNTEAFNVLDLAQLVFDNKKVQAIKQLRETTQQSVEVTIRVDYCIDQNKELLAAINKATDFNDRVRLPGVPIGLKEAKDFIDLLQLKMEN